MRPQAPSKRGETALPTAPFVTVQFGVGQPAASGQNFVDPSDVVYRLATFAPAAPSPGAYESVTSEAIFQALLTGRMTPTSGQAAPSGSSTVTDIRIVTIAAGIALVAITATAQEHGGRTPGERQAHGEQSRQEQSVPYPSVPPAKIAPGVLSLLPADFVTEHTIDTSSGKLAYTATAGTFTLFDQSGERSAAVFDTAFVAKSNNLVRPVTFGFNGGPGAGSLRLPQSRSGWSAHRHVRQRL